MDKRDDSYFINLVLKGNIEAFSWLVEKHQDNVFNLAFRICGRREEAEEISQDSFMKAFRSLKEFRMKSSFSTWLYRITFNTAVSYVRIKKKGLLYLEEFPAEPGDFFIITGNEEEAEREYRKSLVSFALQKISEDERALISLYYYDELNVNEISEITGMSPSNVKVKLFRARQKMASIIEKTGNKKPAYNEQPERF